MSLSTIIAVGIGGATGAIIRLIISNLMPSFIFVNFPLPILVINIIGCFVMGLLTNFLSFYWSPSESIKAFLITGLLGGFTTFSSFSLEFGLLVEKKLYLESTLYAVLSLILSLLGFFAGHKLAKLLFF